MRKKNKRSEIEKSRNRQTKKKGPREIRKKKFSKEEERKTKTLGRGIQKPKHR